MREKTKSGEEIVELYSCRIVDRLNQLEVELEGLGNQTGKKPYMIEPSSGLD